MTDENITTLTTEQQRRAEAASKAKEILYKPGFSSSRMTAFEAVQLAQFILTGETPSNMADENAEEKTS